MNDTQNQLIAVCPDCASILRVNFSKLGQNVRCPQCRRTFIAGEALESAAKPSTEQPAAVSGQASEPVERIEAVCTGCQATLHVRKTYIGSNVRCKYCDQVFRVQAPAERRHPIEPDQAAARPEAFRAEQERLNVAHNLLRADHDRLKSEYHDLRDNLNRVTTELDTIRGALGTITPEEVPALVTDRQSLAAEVHRLGEEIHALLAVRAERDQLVAEVQKWSSDLTAAGSERDLLVAHLKERDDLLHTIRAELDGERARFARQLKEHDDHLDTVRADVERLKLEQQTTFAEVERLETALANRDAQLLRERACGSAQLAEAPAVSDANEAQTEASAQPLLPSEVQSETVDNELEDLRAQLAELSQRLEESERLNREMAAVLDGMGIRCRPIRIWAPA